MRGNVVMFDQASGVGTIQGDDGRFYRFAATDAARPDLTPNQGDFKDDQGRRYTFTATEIVRAVEFRSGMRVEFVESGDVARQIVVVPMEGASHGHAAPQSVADSGSGERATRQSWDVKVAEGNAVTPRRGMSLWGYFLRNLAWWNHPLRGRVSRREFWGSYLFIYLSLGISLMLAFIMMRDGYGDLDGNFYVPALIVGICLTPMGFNLCIRRLHDVGLSAWFWLLCLVPYLGGIIMLVINLQPSQPIANKWGPPPGSN